MLGLRAQLFLYHPIDSGHESWTRREDLIQKIQKIPKIQQPNRIFSVGINAADERLLRSIVEELGHRALSYLQTESGTELEGNTADYVAVLVTVKQLDLLGRVDNPIVLRMILETKQHIKHHLTSLEQKAKHLAADNKFESALTICDRLSVIGDIVGDLAEFEDVSINAQYLRDHVNQSSEQQAKLDVLEREMKSSQDQQKKLDTQLKLLDAELKKRKDEAESAVTDKKKKEVMYELATKEIKKSYENEIMRLQKVLAIPVKDDSDEEGREQRRLTQEKCDDLKQEMEKKLMEAATRHQQETQLMDSFVKQSKDRIEQKNKDISKAKQALVEEETRRVEAEKEQQRLAKEEKRKMQEEVEKKRLAIEVAKKKAEEEKKAGSKKAE